MKFVEGERDENIKNTKVNLENPVAKQRGAEYVILDVTNLELSDNEKIELIGAVAKFYESNFWINLKSVGLMTWLTLILLKSLKSYKSFKHLESPLSQWKCNVFELVDIGKDFVWLYGK